MKERPLDVRLDPLHAKALQDLQRLNFHRYPIDTARELIRKAAQEAGVWPKPEQPECNTSAPS